MDKEVQVNIYLILANKKVCVYNDTSKNVDIWIWLANCTLISRIEVLFMYKLYAIINVEYIVCSVFEPFLRYLPKERRSRMQRFRRSIDRKNCVLSYFLLQYGLYENYSIRSFALSNGIHGKPYLSDHTHIHFNISHCNNGCICAIADSPIGLDIQDIRPFSWSVANHCCLEKEKQLLRECSDPATEFTKIWTMKESYLKMKGTGITVDLCTVDATKLRDKIQTFEINDCYIFVASAESVPEEEICLN